jgi:hypothetical protein
MTRRDGDRRHARGSEPRAAEIRSGEVRVAEIGPIEVRPAEIRSEFCRLFRPPSVPGINAFPQHFQMLLIGHWLRAPLSTAGNNNNPTCTRWLSWGFARQRLSRDRSPPQCPQGSLRTPRRRGSYKPPPVNPNVPSTNFCSPEGLPERLISILPGDLSNERDTRDNHPRRGKGPRAAVPPERGSVSEGTCQRAVRH